MTDKDLLGRKVRDKVTGFTGIATCVAHYLNGCTRVNVEAPVKDDGTLRGSEFFDIDQIEVVGDGVRSASAKADPTGGPQRSEPPRM